MNQDLRQNFSQAAQSLTKLFNSANQQYKEAYAKGQKDMIKEIVQFCLAENNNLKTIELEKLEIFLEAKLSNLNQKPAMYQQQQQQQQQALYENAGLQQKDIFNMQNRGIELEGVQSSLSNNQYIEGNEKQFNNTNNNTFIPQGQHFEQNNITQNQYMQQGTLPSGSNPLWNQQQDQSIMSLNQAQIGNNHRKMYCVQGMKSQND